MTHRTLEKARKQSLLGPFPFSLRIPPRLSTNSAFLEDWMANADESRPLLTFVEAAKETGLNERTVSQAVRDGQIPGVRIGKRTMIPRAALAKILDGSSSS